MAHKHNRRRIRHRSRRNHFDGNLPTVYETDAYGSMSSLSESEQAFGVTISQPPIISGTAILRTWLAQQYTSCYQPQYGASSSKLHTEEAQAMRTFGGEPGEDGTLIGKMQEMFDSMDWVTV